MARGGGFLGILGSHGQQARRLLLPLPVKPPNDTAQQPGPPLIRDVTKSRNAAPVCCSAWFGAGLSGPPVTPAAQPRPHACRDLAPRPGALARPPPPQGRAAQGG